MVAGMSLPHRIASRLLVAFKRRRPWTSVGTRTIVLSPTGGVLLVRHSYVAGWHLPGGGVDRFETLATAAAREVREETGVVLETPPRLFALYANFGGGFSDHVALFVADGVTGTPRPDLGGFLAGEILEAGVFPVDALPPGTTRATRRRLAEIRGEAPVAEHWGSEAPD